MSEDILLAETGRQPVRRPFAVWTAVAALSCASVSTEPVDGLDGSLSRKSSGGSGSTESGAGGTSGAAGAAGIAGAAGTTGAAGTAGAGGGGASAGTSSASNAGSGGSQAGAGAISGSGGAAGSSGISSRGAGFADAGGAVGTGENLIENPGFEAGLTPWTAVFGGTLAVTTEQAHAGLHSGKVSDRTYDYQGVHYDLTSLVSPGASYAASAFARVGNGTGATLKLTAQLTCSGETNPRYSTLQEVTNASDSAWSALGGTLAIPTSSDCALVHLLLYVEGPPAGYDLYVDDVSVTPL
jgi:hypothetical protein